MGNKEYFNMDAEVCTNWTIE